MRVSLADCHVASVTLLFMRRSSGNFEVVSKEYGESFDRLDRELAVLERRASDRLCNWRVLLALPPKLELELSNLSFFDPSKDPLMLPSPEMVLLRRLFAGDPGDRPRMVFDTLSLSNKSLGAALISMLSRICDTSVGVMPITLAYPAADPYFLFMYSMVLCIVWALEAITSSLVK